MCRTLLRRVDFQKFWIQFKWRPFVTAKMTRNWDILLLNYFLSNCYNPRQNPVRNVSLKFVVVIFVCQSAAIIHLLYLEGESRMQFQDEKKCFLIYFKTNMMQFLDEKKLLVTTRNPAWCKTWMRRRCSWTASNLIRCSLGIRSCS